MQMALFSLKSMRTHGSKKKPKKKPVQCSHEAGIPSRKNHETREIRLHLFTSKLNDKRVGCWCSSNSALRSARYRGASSDQFTVLEPTTSEPSRVILPHTRPPGAAEEGLVSHGPGTTREEEDAGFFFKPPPPEFTWPASCFACFLRNKRIYSSLPDVGSTVEIGTAQAFFFFLPYKNSANANYPSISLARYPIQPSFPFRT